MRPASTVLIMQLSNSRMGDDGVPVDVIERTASIKCANVIKILVEVPRNHHSRWLGGIFSLDIRIAVNEKRAYVFCKI